MAQVSQDGEGTEAEGVCPEAFAASYMLATTGPQEAWEYVLTTFDANEDLALQYEEFEQVWADIVSWLPPCMEGDMTPTDLSQTFAQMPSLDWPYTDECFADTRTPEAVFDQIKDAESSINTTEFAHLFWGVQTGDYSYFPECGSETYPCPEQEEEEVIVDVCTLATAEEFCGQFDTSLPVDMQFDFIEISELHYAFCDCHYSQTAAGTAEMNPDLELLCEETDCQ